MIVKSRCPRCGRAMNVETARRVDSVEPPPSLCYRCKQGYPTPEELVQAEVELPETEQ